MLNDSRIREFWDNGYLVVADAVNGEELSGLRAQLQEWVEESRSHREPFGPPTVDGRPRVDMGPEHAQDHPALRRVNNPSEISPAYFQVMSQAAIVDMVADLIGPNVKFHHCKINLKLPGALTSVDYHQDFAYTPHTNDDIVTALLMLDDMRSDNGCLTVVPGSHRGPIYSLFDGKTFSGKVCAEARATALEGEIQITGKAGSVCLMHTRLLHGSRANESGQARGFYICVYSAADAFPIARNSMPNPQEGMIVRGERSRVARLMEAEIELPEQPRSPSFFTVIGQDSAKGSLPVAEEDTR